MAVGIGKYLRSKTRSRRCGKYAVDTTAAVDAVREGLHTPSTMLKIHGRRGILEVDAVDAVFSQTANFHGVSSLFSVTDMLGMLPKNQNPQHPSA